MDYFNAKEILEASPDAFKLLVKKRIIHINVVNSVGQSLMWAVTETDEMEALISSGINLDIQDNGGNTWLHIRYSRYVEIFLQIVETGKYNIKIDPYLKNKSGKTILETWHNTKCIERFKALFTPLSSETTENTKNTSISETTKRGSNGDQDVILALKEQIAKLTAENSYLLKFEKEAADLKTILAEMQKKHDNVKALLSLSS